MLISLGRIIKSGFQNFWRNGYLSVAVIFIIILTILIFSSIVLINVIGKAALVSLEEKVDVSVYLKNSADDSNIEGLVSELKNLDEVKGVEYISKDQALKNFKEEYKDNDVIRESLAELEIDPLTGLEVNPLPPTLNIKAKALDQYKSIVGFLESNKGEVINKINYDQNKDVINRLNAIIQISKKVGLVIGIVMAIVAVLITFNTIRLTIYSHRQEIEIMRLVGASNWYIRMPFVIEGLIYGVCAVIVALAVLYPLVSWLSPRLDGFIPGVDLMGYFVGNLPRIILIQLAVGVGLGVISSGIAVRRYLKA